VRGLNRRQEVRPTLAVIFVEMTVENLVRAIAGARQESSGSFVKITGKEIEDGDYVNNVAIAATIAREGQDGLPVVIVVENALVLESPDFAFADRNETVQAATFVGHFSVSNLTQEPWRMYI